jgi:hypothetical protein
MLQISLLFMTTEKQRNARAQTQSKVYVSNSRKSEDCTQVSGNVEEVTLHENGDATELELGRMAKETKSAYLLVRSKT